MAFSVESDALKSAITGLVLDPIPLAPASKRVIPGVAEFNAPQLPIPASTFSAKQNSISMSVSEPPALFCVLFNTSLNSLFSTSIALKT